MKAEIVQLIYLRILILQTDYSLTSPHVSKIPVPYSHASHHFYVGIHRTIGKTDPPADPSAGLVQDPYRGIGYAYRVVSF